MVVRLVRAQLVGADAEPGRVAAADVARIIVGLERAIARAAYLVLGTARRGPGRHRQAIESAARLRFVGVEPGSFVEVLALPDAAEPTDDELPIPVSDLSALAFERLLTVIAEGGPETDAELASAIAQMATELGIGERNTSITFEGEPVDPSRSAPTSATVDAEVRQRMQRLSAPERPAKDQTLAGVLVEADFEGNTARLRLTDGSAVTVTFPADQADSIQEALRSRTQLEGLVSYHPRTAQAVRVDLRAVVRSVQLAIDDAHLFWRPVSFAELQATQGTTGRVDAGSLAIPDLTDDERAAFLAALAE